MRIALCVADVGEREQLQKQIKQYCELYSLLPEVCCFRDAEGFCAAHFEQRFDLVFMELAAPERFLEARQLRERDKQVKIVCIDDTAKFAVNSVRLHFTDYIVRPVTFKSLVRAMKLAGC